MHHWLKYYLLHQFSISYKGKDSLGLSQSTCYIIVTFLVLPEFSTSTQILVSCLLQRKIIWHLFLRTSSGMILKIIEDFMPYSDHVYRFSDFLLIE